MSPVPFAKQFDMEKLRISPEHTTNQMSARINLGNKTSSHAFRKDATHDSLMSVGEESILHTKRKVKTQRRKVRRQKSNETRE